jgi:hypothetical protein
MNRLLIAKRAYQQIDPYRTQIVKNFNLYAGTLGKFFLIFPYQSQLKLKLLRFQFG